MLDWVDRVIKRDKRKYKKYLDFMNHGPVNVYKDIFDKSPKSGLFYTDDYVIWLENTLLALVQNNIVIKKILDGDIKDDK